MIDYRDPIMDNYYAFLLAIVYPYFLTADEALDAIRFGVNPLVVTNQTLEEALELSKKRKIPRYFSDFPGRRYEVIKFLSEVICETNKAMQGMRDYELSQYSLEIIRYMKKLRERMEENRIR